MENSSSRHQGRWIITALITSALSFAIHIYLVMTHYNLKLGLGGGESLCNINSKFNCDVVSLSRFATLFGAPIAAWGAATHLILIFWLLIYVIGLADQREKILRLSLCFSGFIFLTSLVMGSISTFYLGTFCLFCIFTYLLSAALLFSLWKAQEPSHGASPIISFLTEALLQSKRWMFVTLLLIPAGALVSHSMVMDSYGLNELPTIVNESVSDWKNATPINFNLDNALMKKNGSGPAKMMIVEFADYMCPHCQHAYPTFMNFVQSHPGVEFRYKSFPLDGQCNPMPGYPKRDGLSCDLAYTVFCAEKVAHKGFEAQKYIFDRQQTLSKAKWDADLETLTKDLSLSKADIEQCSKDPATLKAILDQAQEGVDAKIKGTPSIFVNGKPLERGVFFPVLEGVYKAL